MKKAGKAFKFILTRALIFYLLLFLICMLLIDEKKIGAGFEIKRLFQRVPGFEYLMMYDESKGAFDNGKLKEYILYYEKTAEYLPDAADALGVLGVCYYYAGKFREAEDSFLSAIEKQPDFFWFYYNLGILYYRQGGYDKALSVFLKGMKTKPSDALKYIDGSRKIFWPLLGAPENFSKVKERLWGGYRDTYILAVLCCFRTGNYSLMRKLSEDALVRGLNRDGFFNFFLNILGQPGQEQISGAENLLLRGDNIFIKIL